MGIVQSNGKWFTGVPRIVTYIVIVIVMDWENAVRSIPKIDSKNESQWVTEKW